MFEKWKKFSLFSQRGNCPNATVKMFAAESHSYLLPEIHLYENDMYCHFDESPNDIYTNLKLNPFLQAGGIRKKSFFDIKEMINWKKDGEKENFDRFYFNQFFQHFITVYTVY